MGEGVAVEAATESQLITGRRNKTEEKTKKMIIVEEGGGVSNQENVLKFG